jgi:hypothetical protein
LKYCAYTMVDEKYTMLREVEALWESNPTIETPVQTSLGTRAFLIP